MLGHHGQNVGLVPVQHLLHNFQGNDAHRSIAQTFDWFQSEHLYYWWLCRQTQEKQKNSNTGESLHIHHSEASTGTTTNPTINL